MKKLFFSVVIPLYNKEKYIKRTLDSVLNQTFANFEIVIVDDGSKDNSCEIVESITDPRIRLICQDNGGPSKARNRGIKEAKGQFIAFLDADDEWLPEKLEKQYILHSENKEIVWSCSGYKVVGGTRENNVLFNQSGILADAIDAIVNGLSIWTSTVVIKRDIFKNGRFLFNEDFIRSEDRELWYKMACMYKEIGYVNSLLAQYNTGVNNSLMNSAEADVNYTFISVENRIEYELSKIESLRKGKLLFYLNAINTRAVINLWMKTNEFEKYYIHFDKKFSKSFLDSLVYWSFLPYSIKKIFLKYWTYTHPLKEK